MNYQNLFSLLFSKHQYLDPGSGSMLIQIIIAAVLGAGIAIRVFWKNIKAFFTGKKGSDVSEEDPTEIFDDDPTGIFDNDPTEILEEDPTILPLESTATKE